MELLRRVERFAAPYVLVMTAILVGWAINEAGGLGPILERSSFQPTKPGVSVWSVPLPAEVMSTRPSVPPAASSSTAAWQPPCR